MLEGIVSSLARRAFSNASMVWCAGDSVMKTSVLPHQIITRRSRFRSALKRRMSSRTCCASSILFAPRFTFGPSSLLT